MLIGGQEFDPKCPEECPGKKMAFSQGGLCHRCPVFNCVPAKGDTFVLLEPEEYRKDWAKVWRQWFDDGMKGCPELTLEIKE